MHIYSIYKSIIIILLLDNELGVRQQNKNCQRKVQGFEEVSEYDKTSRLSF